MPGRDFLAVMAFSAALAVSELHSPAGHARTRASARPEEDPGHEERVARVKAQAEERRQRRRGRRAAQHQPRQTTT